jgi:hypothetical protein
MNSLYKQVLGNAYVMDSERQIISESQFKLGEISVREFIRRLAKSDLYRSRFFESCARYRYIELTFRHLLGRAPVLIQKDSIAKAMKLILIASSIPKNIKITLVNGWFHTKEDGRQKAVEQCRNLPGVFSYFEVIAAAALKVIFQVSRAN